MTIKEWLSSSREYEAGRQLYERHGSNTFLKRTLSSGPSSYNTSALHEELRKLARSPQLAQASVPVALPAPPAPERLPPAGPPPPKGRSANFFQQPLDNSLKQLYDRRSLLRAAIVYKPQEERRRDAFEILDLTQKIEQHLHAIAQVGHGAKAGAVFIDEAQSLNRQMDLATIRKRIGTLRSNISKNKDKPAKAAAVAAWEHEKHSLQAKLKDATPR